MHFNSSTGLSISPPKTSISHLGATEAIITEPDSAVAHFAMGLVFLESNRIPAARLQFACVLRSLETPAVLVQETQQIIQDTGPLEVDGAIIRPDGDPPIELLGCGAGRPRD